MSRHRNRNSQLPSVDDGAVAELPPATASHLQPPLAETEQESQELHGSEEPKVAEGGKPPFPTFASLVVPLGPETVDGGYTAHRVDVNNMSKVQRNNLKRLTRGLEDSGAKLKNGKAVTKSIDAIRWVLEKLSDG